MIHNKKVWYNITAKYKGKTVIDDESEWFPVVGELVKMIDEDLILKVSEVNHVNNNISLILEDV